MRLRYSLPCIYVSLPVDGIKRHTQISRYPFALDPEWPRFFSESKDIWQYLNKVCDCFSLRKHMRFGTEVIDAQWNARRGEWKVKCAEYYIRLHPPLLTITRTKCHATGAEAVDVCDLLILGTGIFNNYKYDCHQSPSKTLLTD